MFMNNLEKEIDTIEHLALTQQKQGGGDHPLQITNSALFHVANALRIISEELKSQENILRNLLNSDL